MRALSVSILVPVAVMAAPAIAQEADGYWTGTLRVGTAELPVGFDIRRGEDGALNASLDSPSQGSFDIPVDAVRVEGDTLIATVSVLSGRYEGAWDSAARRWTGSWTQGGQVFPLALTRGERPDRSSVSRPEPLPESWSIPSDMAVANILEARIADRPGAGYAVGILDGGVARDISVSSDGSIDEKTLFEIGSITKVFTGLILAQMVLDGTVSLDDPVSTYLPEGAIVPTRAGKQITLRNLSQHDSGLPRLPENLMMTDPADPYADYTEADMLAFLASYELPRDVGSEFEYSNLGVGLLGYALARAEGTDYETLLRRRLTDPLGMKDTVITLSKDQEARFVTGHDGYMRQTSAWDLSVLAGAGGVRSTLSDMQTFAAAALDPVSPIADAMTLALAETRDGTGFIAGLGWAIGKAPGGMFARHGGGTGGFRSHIAIQPATKRATVVLTNASPEPSASDIGMHLLVGAPVLENVPVPQAPATIDRTQVTLSEAELDRVVGTYRFAPGLDLTIERRGAQLFAAVTGQGALPIFPSSPTRFFYRAVEADILFAEMDGAITGAAFTQDGRMSPLTKVE